MGRWAKPMILRKIFFAVVAIAASLTPVLAIVPPVPVVLRDPIPHLAGQDRPLSFDLQSVADIGDGTSCVVGADTVTGEPTKKAAIFRINNSTGKIVWYQSLQVPSERYGSRATYCLVSKGSLYVVILSDLPAPYFPMQNFMSIARLDIATGSVAAGAHATLSAKYDRPEFGRGRQQSTWTEPGSQALQLDGSTIVIKLRYSVANAIEGSQLFKQSEPADAEIRVDDEHLMPSD